MIIILTQTIILAFLILCVYCEYSDKYRNCNWHVFVRGLLMVFSAIVAAKLQMFATAPIIIQFLILALTAYLSVFMYKRVLKRQMKIKNFRLIKQFLGDDYVKRTYR